MFDACHYVEGVQVVHVLNAKLTHISHCWVAGSARACTLCELLVPESGQNLGRGDKGQRPCGFLSFKCVDITALASNTSPVTLYINLQLSYYTVTSSY